MTTFGDFDKERKRKKEEFLLHVRTEIKERFFSGKEMEYEEYQSLMLNSYEQRLCFELLSTKSLIEVMRVFYYHSQHRELGSFKLGTCYDNTLTGILLPLLLKKKD